MVDAEQDEDDDDDEDEDEDDEDEDDWFGVFMLRFCCCLSKRRWLADSMCTLFEMSFSKRCLFAISLDVDCCSSFSKSFCFNYIFVFFK